MGQSAAWGRGGWSALRAHQLGILRVGPDGICGWYGEAHVPFSGQRRADLAHLVRDEYGAYWHPDRFPVGRLEWDGGPPRPMPPTMARLLALREEG